jgi:hypothetical protein|tara:strand:- start:622 stop:735 length:114 start_codon:yes stop_codon:yes gene_type:complete
LIERLRVRIAYNEVDAFQIGSNHIVDGVAASATDAYY